LIEGAHLGIGLGDAFLKHIQRTRVLIHVIDGLSAEPFADYSQINSELALFDPQLAKKPQIVVFNKIDLPDVMKRLSVIKKQFEKHKIEIIGISAVSHENLNKLLWQAHELLKNTPQLDLSNPLPVYRPGARLTDFSIKHISDGWKVSGQAIERAAAMTYWEYDDSIRRFQRIMVSMGVDQALRDAGVKEGENVIIGKHELTWQD
jgi:GTP-binding protein